MKLQPLPSLAVLVFSAALASAQPTNPVQRVTLDPLAVIRIPVALDRLTTLRLPSPPSDVESARVATEVHPEALFLLNLQPGSASFSVRALVPNTNTTLNVSWKGQTYVLELFESHQPWLSVVFDPPPVAPARGASGTARGVPPARLLGLLDTAKAYGLLRQQYPAAVANVEVVRPNTFRDYGDYAIRTEEVFRFDTEDTLVFRVAISNQTGAVLQYFPESLMVRAGTRVYCQSLAEATNSVPPLTSVPVYFAITGSADGSPNSLSPKNDFMILLQRVATVAAAPPPAAPPAVPPAPPASTSSKPAAAPASASTVKNNVWQSPAGEESAWGNYTPPPPVRTTSFARGTSLRQLGSGPQPVRKKPSYMDAYRARMRAAHAAREVEPEESPAGGVGFGFQLSIGFP